MEVGVHAVSKLPIYLFYREGRRINKINALASGWAGAYQRIIICCSMIENERTPSLDKKQEIEWTNYNYPPLINIIHFVPAELPHDRKFLALSLFGLHLASLAICLLNFIDNCVEGGIGILYSLLFALIFTPLLLLVFYRGLSGLCKPEGSLKLFLILQPIAMVLELIGSIVDFLGFNGFMRVSELFKEGRGAAATLGLIVSILFLVMAVYSAFIYIQILRRREALKAN